MGLTKEQRIGILLGIDGIFFLVELSVGYAVHSLALVADAFHMLNDVLSLCVGLWAVRVAQTESSKMYTYGWQRAETLGALVNGVFLVALCMTLFLEAIQRFVEPQDVSNPKLVLIVGCLGLASNILGLFLFHDHSHGHGHGHGEHSHGNDVKDAEEGHAHNHDHSGHSHKHNTTNERTPLITHSHSHDAGSNGKAKEDFTRSDEENTTISSPSTPSHKRKSVGASSYQARHRRKPSVDDIPVHPASLRQSFVYQDSVAELSEPESEEVFESDTGGEIDRHGHDHDSHHRNQSPVFNHKTHFHSQPKKEQSSGGGGHGHSHGDLNMRGVFLHVLGDALGNIGVIATALIIWKTTWSFKMYFDPGISLVITIIILTSAIPLCKAASRILLQAVPMGMSIDEIRQDIEDLDGVEEAHHVHVWQLSDTKLVASLHVKVDCEVKGAGSARYMRLAREIRACLHGFGIHSSTIQPEFMQGAKPNQGESSAESSLSAEARESGQVLNNSKPGSLRSAKGSACMLDCDDDCEPKGQCCPPGSTEGQK